MHDENDYSCGRYWYWYRYWYPILTSLLPFSREGTSVVRLFLLQLSLSDYQSTRSELEALKFL